MTWMVWHTHAHTLQSDVVVGHGVKAYEAAKAALKEGVMYRIPWVSVEHQGVCQAFVGVSVERV